MEQHNTFVDEECIEQSEVLKDADIREQLFDYLEETFGKIRILEEKRIARSRADVVMVMEQAVAGIEIKSDADTYTRLSRQVKDYDLYYDYNYVVVGSTHALHIEEHVPEYWGIVTVERMDREKLDFYMLRRAKTNPQQKLFLKLSLLWRPELVHIQELNHMPKYQQMSKQFVLEKIFKKVPKELLDEQISSELFERDYNSIAQKINTYREEHHQKKHRSRKRKSSRVKLEDGTYHAYKN